MTYIFQTTCKSEIDISALEILINDLALLNILTNHRCAVNRRWQMQDEKYFSFIHF